MKELDYRLKEGVWIWVLRMNPSRANHANICRSNLMVYELEKETLAIVIVIVIIVNHAILKTLKASYSLRLKILSIMPCYGPNSSKHNATPEIPGLSTFVSLVGSTSLNLVVSSCLWITRKQLKLSRSYSIELVGNLCELADPLLSRCLALSVLSKNCSIPSPCRIRLVFYPPFKAIGLTIRRTKPLSFSHRLRTWLLDARQRGTHFSGSRRPPYSHLGTPGIST